MHYATLPVGQVCVTLQLAFSVELYCTFEWTDGQTRDDSIYDPINAVKFCLSD